MPLAFAKTTRPSVAGAMTRRRLHRLLARLRTKAITWVYGPPGVGKTTAVASFVNARRLRALWYQVDGGDADLATFFYHLAQAAAGQGAGLPLLTPEYRAGLDIFARRYFRELYGRLKAPFALVFDNYQEAPHDGPLHEVLRAAAEELPKGGRIIVISRTEPPPSLARLRVHQALDIVEWKHLRLTQTEAAGIARKLGGGRYSAAAIRRLYELTDGWIAGLVLLLNRRGLDEPASRGWHESPQVLFDYFAGEIFSKAPPHTRDVLLQTAVLPVVRPAMATQLTGRSDAAEVIAALHRASYFTNKRAGVEGAYEYHPLFREFLLAQARRTLSPERLDEIRSKAATLIGASGDTSAAADLLHQARNWDALAQLICRHAAAVFAQGRAETVQQWLAWMPEEAFARTPWLLCWRGICQLGRGHDACRRDCERALAAFRGSRDVDGTLLAWSVIVTSHLMEGWLEALDYWIALLDELQAETCTRGSAPVEARVSTAMILAIAFRQLSHHDGATWAQRALDSTRGNADLGLRCLAAFGWFLYHWLIGNPSTASLVIDEMRALSRRRDVPSIVALQAAVPVVWYEMFHASPACRQTVAEIREHARATGLRHALCASVLTFGAFSALSDGDLELGSAWRRQLGEESASLGPTYMFAYHIIVVIEALARDDLERASAHVDELARLGYSTGYPLEEAYGHTLAAYVLSRRGHHEQARAHVRRALAGDTAIHIPYAEWFARLAEAHVSFAAGLEAEGLHALTVAMKLGRAHGYVNSHVWLPSTMAPLCARALDAGIEVEYVRGLVRQRRLVCDPPPLEIEAWPWPIRIVALGRFVVLKDDRPIRSVGKVQRKPLALLKTLIAHGASGVHEERVMDALWPDAEGDAARRALTTAVFRLRRLLGDELAVVRGDRRIGLNPARCWVDVWAIERLLERAEAAGSKGNANEAARLADRAAGLYRGPLVGAGDDDMLTNARGDRLRRRLMRQLVATGRRLEMAQEWQRAADILEAALRVDPCAEDVYGSLMTMYHRLGRPADVEAAYERCRRTLEGELGICPSPKTEAMLAALSSSE